MGKTLRERESAGINSISIRVQTQMELIELVGSMDMLDEYFLRHFSGEWTPQSNIISITDSCYGICLSQKIHA